MKPFSKDRTIAGDPFAIVQWNGSSVCIPVRFVGELTDGRIVVERQADSGTYYVEVCREDQLGMLPVRRTVWITLHKQADSGAILPFLSEAKESAWSRHRNSMNSLGCFAIEIED